MITTSKLNSNIVFSLLIFWGLTANEMRANGRLVESLGPRIRAEGRGSRNTNNTNVFTELT